MNPSRKDGVTECHVEQLIVTWHLRGLGTEGDPVRSVTTVWTFDGKIVAESDPLRTVSVGQP